MEQIPEELSLALEALKSHQFDAWFAETAGDAKKMMLEMIPKTASVGVGDSATLRQIGILGDLLQQGNRVINPFAPETTNTQDIQGHLDACRRCFMTDVFLTSANAVTEDGKIISIDGAGNRVAGIIFGARRVILPIGRNKLVENEEAAIERIKNVIAPAHARRKGRKTPCAVTGRCNDCRGADRICRVTVILERRPLHTELSVILINEDLGLGWDPAWDENHISEIYANYYQNTWVYSFR